MRTRVKGSAVSGLLGSSWLVRIVRTSNGSRDELLAGGRLLLLPRQPAEALLNGMGLIDAHTFNN